MRRAITFVALAILAGVLLGGTVFRDEVANARSFAQDVFINNTPAQAVPVREQNLDGNQNIKVHEQGIVSSRPAAPSSTWYAQTQLTPSATRSEFIAGPRSDAINLTSLSVGPYGTGVPNEPTPISSVVLQVYTVPATSSNCTDGQVFAGFVWWMAHVPAPLAVAFPTPIRLVAPSGKKVCLWAGLPSGSVGTESQRERVLR